jgi:hypothetical protein
MDHVSQPLPQFVHFEHEQDPLVLKAFERLRTDPVCSVLWKFARMTVVLALSGELPEESRLWEEIAGKLVRTVRERHRVLLWAYGPYLWGRLRTLLWIEVTGHLPPTGEQPTPPRDVPPTAGPLPPDRVPRYTPVWQDQLVHLKPALGIIRQDSTLWVLWAHVCKLIAQDLERECVPATNISADAEAAVAAELGDQAADVYACLDRLTEAIAQRSDALKHGSGVFLQRWIVGISLARVTADVAWAWPWLQWSHHLLPDNPIEITPDGTCFIPISATPAQRNQLLAYLDSFRPAPSKGRPRGRTGPAPSHDALKAHMLQAARHLRQHGVTLTQGHLMRQMGINGDERRVREWLKELGLTWPQFQALV